MHKTQTAVCARSKYLVLLEFNLSHIHKSETISEPPYVREDKRREFKAALVYQTTCLLCILALPFSIKSQPRFQHFTLRCYVLIPNFIT